MCESYIKEITKHHKEKSLDYIYYRLSMAREEFDYHNKMINKRIELSQQSLGKRKRIQDQFDNARVSPKKTKRMARSTQFIFRPRLPISSDVVTDLTQFMLEETPGDMNYRCDNEFDPPLNPLPRLNYIEDEVMPKYDQLIAQLKETPQKTFYGTTYANVRYARGHEEKRANHLAQTHKFREFLCASKTNRFGVKYLKRGGEQVTKEFDTKKGFLYGLSDIISRLDVKKSTAICTLKGCAKKNKEYVERKSYSVFDCFEMVDYDDGEPPKLRVKNPYFLDKKDLDFYHI